MRLPRWLHSDPLAPPVVVVAKPVPPFAMVVPELDRETEALFRAIRRAPFRELSARPAYQAALAGHIKARNRIFESAKLEGLREVESSFGIGDPDDQIAGPGGGHSIQYRAVAGGGEIGMPVDIVRAIDESRYLDTKSPLKSACSGLTARYMGDVPTVKCEDDTAQKVVDDFFADPYNAFLSDMEELSRRLRVDGQLLLLATTGEDGSVRMRRWDPRNIASAKFEDLNPEAPEHLRIIGALPPEKREQKPTRDGEAIADESSNRESVWRVVRMRDHPDRVPEAEREKHFVSERADVVPTEGPPLLDGEALWFRANMGKCDFGLPDGLAVFHILDQYDELRAQAVRSARIKGTYAMCFKLEGFTRDQVDSFREQYKLPSPGGAAIYFTNDKGEIVPLTFSLGAADFEEHMLALKKLILADYGYPPSFVAEDNATLATALAQSAPTLRSLAAKQMAMERVYRLIVRYVIDTWVYYNAAARGKSRTFALTMSPMSTDQSATQASTLNANALGLRGLDELGVFVGEERGLIRDAARTSLLQTGLVTQEQIEASRRRDAAGVEEPVPERPQDVGAQAPVGPGSAGGNMGLATRISKARTLKALEDPELMRLLT